MALLEVAAPVDAHNLVLPLLVSSVIPPAFRHGFTTRGGGVSVQPFDSLNLGMKWGDSRANVLENRRRVRVASGGDTLVFASQVHGANVVRVRATDDVAVTSRRQADGLCSDETAVVVAVYVADCVPLLAVDPRTGAFAAVHAGWRGAAAGITTVLLDVLAREFGTRAADLRVAMGPAIGACCFEVGPEVVAAFEAAVPGARDGQVVIEQAGSKPHVDIKHACRLMLEARGVPSASIDSGPECTKCDPAGRFFSYRREHGQTGQHVGFVGRKERP
jgi:YfiH family protein